MTTMSGYTLRFMTLVLLYACFTNAAKKESCAKNQHIKAADHKSGEQPTSCSVITDDLLTVKASSLKDSENYGNDKAGLGGEGVLTDKTKYDMVTKKKLPYIMVDLPGTLTVCGVVISGRPDWPNDYPKEFSVMGSVNGEEWVTAYQDVDAGSKIFTGSGGGGKTAVRFFDNTVNAGKLKITAEEIVEGAAAAFRVGVVTNCFYANSESLGYICDSLMCDPKSPHFTDLPTDHCKKYRVVTRAGKCTAERMAWGGDPMTCDSPLVYSAQVVIGHLGQGTFTTWYIPKAKGVTEFEGIFKNGFPTLPYRAENSYAAYTFSPEIYREYCVGKKKN